jgi:hypothetical protein
VSATRFPTAAVLATVILSISALAVWLVPGPHEHVLRDIDGVIHGSLEHPARARWSLLFFLMSDCPIANQYAPEIQRICTQYGPNGVECFLVYVDPAMKTDAIRKHMNDFQYSSCCTGILDSEHQLVKVSGATVSSEVAVFSNNGNLQYRGRIDNFNAALGTPRQRASQHDLRQALDALVAGNAVPHPRTEALGCFIPETDSEE